MAMPTARLVTSLLDRITLSNGMRFDRRDKMGGTVTEENIGTSIQVVGYRDCDVVVPSLQPYH